MKSTLLGVALSLALTISVAAMSDEDQIREALNDGCKAFVAGDVAGMMAPM